MNYQFLPKFKVVEINNMAALRMGHVIAQNKAANDIAVKEVSGVKFLENGIIVGLGADGKIANYDPALHAQPMLVFNEELIEGPLYSLDNFAERVDAVDGVYPRCLPLYLGDTFTTDNIAGSIENGFYKVVAGKLTYEAIKSDATMFIGKVTTLPAGQNAVELQYFKPATVTVAAEVTE